MGKAPTNTVTITPPYRTGTVIALPGEGDALGLGLGLGEASATGEAVGAIGAATVSPVAELGPIGGVSG